MDEKKIWSYNQEKESLTIRLFSILRNRRWAEEFGDVYQIVQHEKVSKITIKCFAHHCNVLTNRQ